MLAYNVHHVAVAVSDLDEAIEKHRRLFGGDPIYRERGESQGVEEAMLPMGGTFIQLLSPLEPDSPVGRFLERRGEGLHHLAYAVADIEAALAHLEREGVALVDSEPRTGGGGHRIAFVHPSAFSSTLIELVEVSE